MLKLSIVALSLPIAMAVDQESLLKYFKEQLMELYCEDQMRITNQKHDQGKRIFVACVEQLNPDAETYVRLFKLFLLPRAAADSNLQEFFTKCIAHDFTNFLMAPPPMRGNIAKSLIERNVANFKLIMRALSEQYPYEAEELFYAMKKRITPDDETYEILITCFSENGLPVLAENILVCMKKDGCVPNSELHCGIIHSFANCGEVLKACSLFHRWLGQEIDPNRQFIIAFVGIILDLRTEWAEIQSHQVQQRYKKWMAWKKVANSSE